MASLLILFLMIVLFLLVVYWGVSILPVSQQVKNFLLLIGVILVLIYLLQRIGLP